MEVTPSIPSCGSLDALARTTTRYVHALESRGRIGTIAAISTFWAAGRSELYLGASGFEEPNVRRPSTDRNTRGRPKLTILHPIVRCKFGIAG